MEEKNVSEYGFTPMDIAYLMDDQKALLKMELQKKKANKRFLNLLKRFASVSKRVEGYTSYLKGYDMDTKAMNWIVEMYSSTPPSNREYEYIAEVIRNYTKVQIWLGNFFSLVNIFNHSLNLRRLSTAEKTLKKLELEIGRGRRIFADFNSSLKNLRKALMEGEKEETPLLYFT